MNRPDKRFMIPVLAGVLSLSGCASVPDREPLAATGPVEVPAGFAAATEAFDAYPAVPPAWLSDFQSAQLPALVLEAQRANPDLARAAARLEAALAAARIAGAPRRPLLSADLDGTRSQSRPLPGSSAVRQTRYQTGLGAQWEADIWGRLGADARAAQLEADAVAADLSAARQALAAGVVRNWINLLAAGEQAALARRTADSFRDNLELVDQRFQRGLAPGLDLSLVRANARSAEASQAAARNDLTAIRLNLETLLGRYPADRLAAENGLPTLSGPVPAGLPAGLLARRPDLRAAFRRLVAADQRFAAARAARLPRISLTASGGTLSNALAALVDGDLTVWSLGGSLTAPLYQGGRLAAAEDQAGADRRTALAAYRQTVLTAFREVETALRREALLEAQAAAQEAAAADAMAAEEQAVDRYRRGLTDVITVLEAQRRSFNARQALITVRQQRLLNRVDLWLALGGAEPPAAATETAAFSDP
ncbi:MAG: efflux transporter outer membrane subunit [Opitutales bacterium]